MHDGSWMGWMNAWWILGILVVAGVLWLAFRRTGSRAPPGDAP